MSSQPTKLEIIDFFYKPRSSLVVLGLLTLNRYFVMLDKLNITIKPSLKEKLVSSLLRVSKDGKYLLNKLSYYSHPIDQTIFKHKSPIEIHSIVSHEVLPCYILMAKSLQYFCRISALFVVHDDGSLTVEDFDYLKEQLPSVLLLTFKHSTSVMKKVLKEYPCLLRYRIKKHKNRINLITTIDIPYFTNSEYVFYIDGDILFFKNPKKICEWLINKNKRIEILYMKDHSNFYVLSEKKCREVFSVGYLKKFNMGILCYHRKLFDLKSINEYFSLLEQLDRDDIMVRDQTYFMIHFQKQRQNLKVLNEKTYLVYGQGPVTKVVDKRRDDTVCCHYTFTVRDYIYKEGIIVLFRMNNLY